MWIRKCNCCRREERREERRERREKRGERREKREKERPYFNEPNLKKCCSYNYKN
jgi:hypothetical protein